ncbi:MAG: alpha/beta fold hydrolase [Bacteroidales bacterium]
MKTRLLLLAMLILSFSCRHDNTLSSYETREFWHHGRKAIIVFPKEPDKQKSWLWRARYWMHEPQTDLALLEKGFHVVYIDVSGLYGSPQAVDIWDDFYNYIVSEYGLNKKAVLLGMSRGGLIVYNWASVNTDKIACIYADAPVLDIKSWPGGLYGGTGSEEDWQACLEAYGLDQESVMDYENIPLNNAVRVAQAGIPVIHVCGMEDRVVPYSENTGKLVPVFKEAGNEMKLILKEGIGHNPHSLEDPAPIVDFILSNIE